VGEWQGLQVGRGALGSGMWGEISSMKVTQLNMLEQCAVPCIHTCPVQPRHAAPSQHLFLLRAHPPAWQPPS
jgi:hypothetical protein